MKGKGTRWTPAMDAMLGFAPDAKVAQALGLGVDTIFRRRKKIMAPSFGRSNRMDDYPQTRAKLGKVPDAEIAKAIGVTKATVAAYRRCRRIPACPRKAPAGVGVSND